MTSVTRWQEDLLKLDLKTPHPFCWKEFLTDGKSVFVEILPPFLKRIDYDAASQLARRWCIADRVVIDPAICLCKPIVGEVGIATAILASAYHANRQDAEEVADWYNVHAKHVLAAVEFERSLVG